MVARWARHAMCELAFNGPYMRTGRKGVTRFFCLRKKIKG